jgi:hypothetical protein
MTVPGWGDDLKEPAAHFVRGHFSPSLVMFAGGGETDELADNQGRHKMRIRFDFGSLTLDAELLDTPTAKRSPRRCRCRRRR